MPLNDAPPPFDPFNSTSIRKTTVTTRTRSKSHCMASNDLQLRGEISIASRDVKLEPVENHEFNVNEHNKTHRKKSHGSNGNEDAQTPPPSHECKLNENERTPSINNSQECKIEDEQTPSIKNFSLSKSITCPSIQNGTAALPFMVSPMNQIPSSAERIHFTPNAKSLTDTVHLDFSPGKSPTKNPKNKLLKQELSSPILPIHPNQKEFLYQEVVRDKQTRKQMHGVDCPCCKDYYRLTKNLKPIVELGVTPVDRKQIVSRHRVWSRRPDTPPGFWMVDFPSTQEIEDNNMARKKK